MIYDTSNPLDKANFMLRARKLAESGKIVELTEKKPKRTLSQNSFLWLCLSYWGSQTGYTKEEAETIYKNVNLELYYTHKVIAGVEIEYIRHTYELDTAEMTASIERFRNWAAMNDACPVYIPSPEDYQLVQIMEIEIERNKEYI